MVTDIERQFFETFGIEPSDTCKYAKYGYEGIEGTWYFCSKNQKECWTYPSDTTCKDKMTSYPEITDTQYLQLIEILLIFEYISFKKGKEHYSVDFQGWSEQRGNSLKNAILNALIIVANSEFKDVIYNQVRTLFEEE